MADGQVEAVIEDGGALRRQRPHQLLVLAELGHRAGGVAGGLEQAADLVVADGQLAAVQGDGGALGHQRTSQLLALSELGHRAGGVAGVPEQGADV